MQCKFIKMRASCPPARNGSVEQSVSWESNSRPGSQENSTPFVISKCLWQHSRQPAFLPLSFFTSDFSCYSSPCIKKARQNVKNQNEGSLEWYLNLQRGWDVNSRTKDFKFIKNLNSFTTLRYTEAGTIWRIKFCKVHRVQRW